MIFLQVMTEEIDHTIPLWGLLTATAICIIFIVNMYIKVRELSRQVDIHEKRLDNGNAEIKKMGTDIHVMSNLLVKINTKLNMYLKIHDDDDDKN
jgi:hypothetical protein